MANLTLHNKIFLGYFILMVVIGCIISILLYERMRVKEIEVETAAIRHVRSEVNIAHRYITELATRGESVIKWNNLDYQAYCKRRLCTDSLLQAMKTNCKSFICAEQIDTLRYLLKTKEIHLQHIMQAIKQKEQVDSLLINRLPIITKQVRQMYMATQKKRGIAGWFKKKEKLRLSTNSKSMSKENEVLIEALEERTLQIEVYADSLKKQNKDLNRKLYTLITFLDGQIQVAFGSREAKIVEAQELSYKLFAFVTFLASILLILLYLIIRHDIGRERRNKDRLQRINQENAELLEMRKRIILTVSHDVRGPLGNISNCVELASDTRQKKKRDEYLENIRHSCRHILHLVNNLMDVYRINEVCDTKNEVPFRLDKLLKNISNEYARKAGYKALLFEQEHLNCGVTVQGDADKLEQILDNLLTNAVKFTLAGSVGFYSSYTDGKLCVEICDTGIGMNEDTLERIFRPFERAAQEINSEGFGLGLFITKNLVEVLEGSISVESHPGKGSVFYVALPLAETSEDCEPEEIHLSSPVILPKRILVVDDDTIQLKIAEDMLTRNGVECTTCRDAKEVITALRYSDYDLVLTDIQMPVTDGFGLLKLLRGSDIGKSKTVPVAVMTARGDGDSGVYIKAGFCGCIHKPFVMKGLMAFISSMMTESSSYPLLFDYSRLIETIGDRQHMFRLVIQESEKDFAELERALKKTNREAMRKTVHRMMPVWELLGADKILSAYQKILHIQETSDDAVREHTLKIMEYIQALIGEANNELEKKDNETEHTCSGG